MSFSYRWQGRPSAAGDGVAHATSSLAAHDPEQRLAGEAYRDLAADLVARFCELLGDGYGQVEVQVDGHANPDHQPAFGWAGDQLSVRVVASPRA